MKRLCCFALSLLPLSAFAYPIEVDPQLNGTEVSYSTQDIGRDMGAILLTNLGGQAAECTAVFRNGPETPKVRKGVIQPGQNSNFTAQFYSRHHQVADQADLQDREIERSLTERLGGACL